MILGFEIIWNDLTSMLIYITNLSGLLLRDDSCICVFNSLLDVVSRVKYVVLYTIDHFPLKENISLTEHQYTMYQALIKTGGSIVSPHFSYLWTSSFINMHQNWKAFNLTLICNAITGKQAITGCETAQPFVQLLLSLWKWKDYVTHYCNTV